MIYTMQENRNKDSNIDSNKDSNIDSNIEVKQENINDKKPIDWTKILKKASPFISILIGLLIGFLFGFYILPKTAFDNLPRNNFLASFIWIIFGILYSVLCVYLHAIIHELGHLLAGYKSGYKFVAFRIFSMVFIKEDGLIKIKKFNIPGTAGQCLMMPPEKVKNRYPFILYNLGGVLFDFSTAIVALVIVLSFDVGIVVNVALSIFIISGLLLGLVNAIPLKVNGVTNDGYNVYLLKKDISARKGLYNILHINGLLTMGMRLKDMPFEWFDIKEAYAYNNTLTISNLLFKASYFFDIKEFDKAREIYLNIKEKSNSLLFGVLKNEVDCELLFYELINECRQEEINKLYTKELQQYIKMTATHINKYKLKYAFASFVEKDFYKAEKELIRLEKSIKDYPVIGEAISEFEGLKYLKETKFH